MSYLFENTKQRYTQWRRVRRGGGYTAGQMTFHSFEAPLGTRVAVGATILCTRPDPGSYHRIFDVFRDHIKLAPWDAETWHSRPTNNWAASASAMMRAIDWKRLNAAPEGSTLWHYRQNIIHGFALAAADFSKWLISKGRNPVPKRVLTTEQALNKEEGFVMHRDTDPKRRRDPADPSEEFPWDELFEEYDRLMGAIPSKPDVEEEIEMDLLFVSYDMGGRKHHYGTLGPAHYTYVDNENDYINARTQMGREVKWWANTKNDRTVEQVSTIFGAYVGPEALRPRGARA